MVSLVKDGLSQLQAILYVLLRQRHPHLFSSHSILLLISLTLIFPFL